MKVLKSVFISMSLKNYTLDYILESDFSENKQNRMTNAFTILQLS